MMHHVKIWAECYHSIKKALQKEYVERQSPMVNTRNLGNATTHKKKEIFFEGRKEWISKLIQNAIHCYKLKIKQEF